MVKLRVNMGDDDGQNGKFHNSLGTDKTILEVLKETREFVDEDPQSFYSLIIGSDSQAHKINGSTEIFFVTAIIIYRKGKGAKYFWKKYRRKVNKVILRDKIYTETLLSLSAAEEIVPEIRKMIPEERYDLEIHIDVGNLGKTREMIREVVGMVTGNGYVAKTKPDSWGASNVADKHA